MSDAGEPTWMSSTERDAVYTQLCQTLTAVGEAQASLLLARLALLLFERLGDSKVAKALIEEAARGLPTRP